MENVILKTAAATSLMVVIALAATGCSKTPSSNVKTSGIYVSYSVVGDNVGSATCEAQFQVGGPTGTFLELDDGDSVTCDGQPMARNEFAGIVTYRVPVTYKPRGSYIVVFTRKDEPQYVATTGIPESITGLNPVSFVGLQKSRPFSVSWTPSLNNGDEMQVALQHSSSRSSGAKFKSGGRPESGVVMFQSEDTRFEESGPINAKIVYRRMREGRLPLGLAGHIRGVQSVSVPVQLTD